MKPVFLESSRLALSPLSTEDNFDSYAAWANDQETTRYMGVGNFPSNIESLRDYIEKFNRASDGILLGIHTKRTKKHIGNITLHLINWKDRHAEIGILIGEKKFRGKGYGAESIRLVTEHAFEKLNLHKLYTGMIEGNEASMNVFKKIGFRLEGTLREHFYLDGKYLDCHRLGLLKKDFK